MFRLKHQHITNIILSANLFINMQSLATAADFDQNLEPYGRVQCLITRSREIVEIDCKKTKVDSEGTEIRHLREQKRSIQNQYLEFFKEEKKDYKKALSSLDVWFCERVNNRLEFIDRRPITDRRLNEFFTNCKSLKMDLMMVKLGMMSESILLNFHQELIG